MRKIARLIDKIYNWAFEQVPIKPQEQVEDDGKFYLPCNILFGNYAKERNKEKKENETL